MEKYLRGTLALLVGALMFGVLSLMVLLAGVLSLGLLRPWLVHAPLWIGKIIWLVVYRGILRMRAVVERTVTHAHVATTVTANHPTNLLTVPFMAHAELLVGMPGVWVGKREHIWNPFVGWPMLAIGIVVLINRGKRKEALESIRRSVRGVFSRGHAFMIFPDRSRPTAKALADDQRDFAGVVERLERFQYTLVPRDGGFNAIYEAPPRQRVLDITAECSVPTVRWRDVFGMVGATYYIRIEDVTGRIPRNLANRRVWLCSRWRVKNRVIKNWRQAP